MKDNNVLLLYKSVTLIFAMTFTICCTGADADSEDHSDVPAISYSELADAEDIFEAARKLSLLAKRDGGVIATRKVVREIAVMDDVSKNLLLAYLPQLAMIPANDQAEGAVPLLNSDEEEERNAAQHFLALLEGKMADWEFYEWFLHDYKDRPPDYFVDYLMNRSPPLALELFADFYGRGIRDPEGKTLTGAAEIARRTLQYHLWMGDEAGSLLTEEERRKHMQAARQALIDLLDLDRWWANVFVAEAAKQYEQLRTPELKQRLLNIEDPLVQQRLDWVRGSHDDPPAPDAGKVEVVPAE